MQTKLAKQPCQIWKLIGISDLHRAIIRRTVMSMQSELRIESTVHWSIDDQAPQSEFQDSDRAIGESSVVFISRNVFVASFEQSKPSYVTPEILGVSKSIRLLWNWSTHGFRDLQWCTELRFSGVVYDVKSLEAWSRMALVRSQKFTNDFDSLTAGIRIPQL